MNCLFFKCAIPVFDGLLPEPHNQMVLKLLFVAAHWHGLAKLRIHTDVTLDILDAVTKDFGDKVQKFKDKTCNLFQTRELPREYNARLRRHNQSACKSGDPVPATVRNSTVSRRVGLPSNNSDIERDMSLLPEPLPAEAQAVPSACQAGSRVTGCQLKSFNPNTYKHHALGDYAFTIRRYGTTDSYSTEAVRLFLFVVRALC